MGKFVNEEVSTREAMGMLGMKRSTFYRLRDEYVRDNNIKWRGHNRKGIKDYHRQKQTLLPQNGILGIDKKH